jgi:hypothetical protein
VRLSGRARLGTLVLAGSITLGTTAAGCGGGGDASTSADRAAPPTSDFPAAKGQSLQDLYHQAQPDQNVVVSPTGRVFESGTDRFGFGVFDVGQKPITGAQVAIYVAPQGGGPASGPYPAREESLVTDPAFQAQTTANDPDAAKVVYVAEPKFTHDGNWDMIAILREGDQLRASLVPTLEVGGFQKIPTVGEQAPRIHTPTVADVNGDVAKIDTRVPPDDMHSTDLYDALGKQPVVLLFATPQLCQSRVCGPVVDIEEQVSHQTGDDVAFIHNEVYEDNDPNKGLRTQMKAFGLPTEPWLFVIDRNGKVSTRIEGAFSASELEAAVKKAEASS